MDVESKKQYWLKTAQQDWEMAELLLEHKRYVYCLFFIHQSLEKTLKALVVVNTGKPAPYTHNLWRLVTKANIEIEKSKIDFLKKIRRYQIEARYPNEKKSIYQIATEDLTRDTLTEAEEIRAWLLEMMK